MHFVFDFGGVLFRWQPPQLLRRVLPYRAGDEASARRWADDIFQGYGGDWAEFDRGALTASELTRRIAARTRLDEDEVRRVIDAVPAALQPVPETVALLRQLHADGRPLSFLSNMPEPYARYLERTHDFVACFGAGVFSSRVGWVKPEPQIFELAAQRFAVDPARLVFIDDLPANVEAARRAGWHALHFEDALRCERQLRSNAWL